MTRPQFEYWRNPQRDRVEAIIERCLPWCGLIALTAVLMWLFN